MRTPRFLYVVFVRLRTGSSVVHAASGNHRLARYHFREAEKRTDCDQIWLETYSNCRRRSAPKATRSAER